LLAGVADAEKVEEALEKPPLASTFTMYCSAPDPPASAAAATARVVPDIYAPQVFDGVYSDPETTGSFQTISDMSPTFREGAVGVLSAYLKRAAIN